MAIKPKFNPEKAIEVLLYIAEETSDVCTALKILYFADKEHLTRYGRLICGDRYAVTPYGPMPSGTYDLIRDARKDRPCQTDLPILDAFTVSANCITPRRGANRDLLSMSDMECLDAGLLTYQEAPYTGDELEEGRFIRLEAIIRRLPRGEELLEYLNTD